jgi:hypothetical protein
MITQVKVGQNYINVSVAVTNNSGQKIDPTNAEAWFYKISQIDGSLSLDTNIGGTGKVTLNKQDGQIGFYGASINISSFLETEYVILYKITAEVAETITVEYLSIDLSKKQIGEIKIETDKIPLIQNETEKIKKILGLTQENFKLYNCIYDGINLISANIKIYPTAADLESDTNVIATYSVNATYDSNGNCTLYKVKLL